MNYTNSPLISYTKYSPNNSGRRTHEIDRITPHCVVGQCSVESLGNLFANPSRKASSNYGIGADGRIALYVDEENKSWCSSNNANDQRAITIECASAATAPYAFTVSVYAALEKLCVDICRRYNKKKLIWIPDKSKALAYKIKEGEMLLTVHRWFANKECPGQWLYDRLGQLAQEVTSQLTPTIKDADYNERIIWDSLMSYIGNEFGAAGLMGNLYAESGLRANNLQNSFENKLGMDDITYTAAVDNNIYRNFVRDKAGYGLAQWTFYTRKQALMDYAKKHNTSIGDLQMQLEYLEQEIKGYKAVYAALKTAKSIKEASDAVLTGFEKPADQSDAVKAKRASYGQVYYNKFVGAIPAPKPEQTDGFKVRVEIDNLSIRKGAGTNTERVGFTGKGVFTILEVRSGEGSKSGWGRLKSGKGWISLDYATRI